MEIKQFNLIPQIRDIALDHSNDDLFVTIKIGNGQIGGSKIDIDGRILKGDFSQPTFLGKSSALKDKEFSLQTNILDVNPQTNMCVYTTTFMNQDNKILFSKIDKGEAPDCGVASFNGKYKIKLLTLFFLFSTFSTFFSQNNDVSYKDLETPSSPGFILLDSAPSSIEKPTTPQGFGISVLGFLRGTGGAMEVAPFWLMSHSNYTAERMYNDKFPILSQLSVSATTVKSDSINYLSAGIRTRLFQKYSQKSRFKLDSIKKDIILALADLDTTKLKELKDNYIEIIEKPVFTIDLAAALSASSIENSFDDLIRNRWAAWLNFNYRPNVKDFYVTFLTRYLLNDTFQDYIEDSKLLDLGSRINYDIDKFCISLEYIQRLDFSNKLYDDNRIAIIVSYKLTDNIFFTSTFGKNFSDVNNIIALAGLNFGFSKNKQSAF